MLKRFLLFTLILFAIVESTEAQEHRKKLFEPLAAAVKKLHEIDHPQLKLHWKSPQGKTLWKSMADDLTFLQKLDDERKNESSARYRESLKQDEEAILGALSPDIRIRDKLETCEAVAEDVKIKRVYAEDNLRAAFNDVKVTVHTKKGNIERRGFQVWYVPKAWRKKKARHERFDQNSSPTDGEMSPGAYIMWTKVPDRDESGKRQPIDVGKNGRPKQAVDLPVP